MQHKNDYPLKTERERALRITKEGEGLQKKKMKNVRKQKRSK
jgi:hypothetical protein